MTAPAEPERTPDGRYIVVDGRRWRATDPGIPEALRAELVAELMAARRIQARARVQDAKVALGERGEPWWEPTEAGRRDRLAAAARTLLRHRDPDRTICPSDAARVVGGDGFRRLMPLAREVAAELAEQGVLEVRQRDERVDLRTAKGPVRLARGAAWPDA
jgi:hypothetical protein